MENSKEEKNSNEQVIDDLMKDFESSNINSSDQTDDKEQPVEKSKENEFDDFIDEEGLKELEEKMTGEEKTCRFEVAQQLKEKGNKEFKSGEYLESINTYTSALRLCPLSNELFRSILYSNRSASKTKLERKETAIDDCTKSLALNPTYAKVLLRRAKLYEETNKLDESLDDYKRLKSLEPQNTEYDQIINELNIKIEKRNEEMKTEMLGKLKDLGNMLLKPFGLSTDNFQLNQDPNSGGYSINFQQNK